MELENRITELKQKRESILSEIKYARSYFQTNLLNKVNELKLFDINRVKIDVDFFICMFTYIYDLDKKREVSIYFYFLNPDEANGYSLYKTEEIERLGVKTGDIKDFSISNIHSDFVKKGDYEDLNAVIFYGEIAKDIKNKGKIYDCIQHYQSILTPLHNDIFDVDRKIEELTKLISNNK